MARSRSAQAPQVAAPPPEIDELRRRLGEAEARLASAEQRMALLQLALDALPDSFWVKDAAMGYQLVNRAFREFHQLGDADIYGRSADELFAPHMAIGIRSGDQKALQSDQIYRNELRLEQPGGRSVWIETIKRRMTGPDGSLAGIVGLTRDVTARHDAVEARLAMERAFHESQRRESLGLLAGGVAHDFNNLLTGILGHADLALLDAPAEGELSESLRQIISGAQAAARLASQLLAYAGKGRILIQALDINQLIGEMADLMRVSLPRSSALRYSLSPGLPPVEGDIAQIQQVLLNLITNAADALGPAGGEVQVITRLERLPAAAGVASSAPASLPPGEYVQVIVADNGVGMDEPTIGRIFDPFFSTKRPGRGLGLAAVQGIVEAHRGAISVESQPGTGSIFRLWLPATAAPPERPASDAAAQGLPQGGFILLVDDDPEVRQIVRKQLERCGLRVGEAASGEQAIELLESGAARPIAVLLDLTMPGIGGATTARVLQRRHSRIPVILMSGYHTEQITSDYADLRPAAMLHKPFDLETLRSTLAAALAA